MLWLQSVVKLGKVQQYERAGDRTKGLCPRIIKKNLHTWRHQVHQIKVKMNSNNNRRKKLVKLWKIFIICKVGHSINIEIYHWNFFRSFLLGRNRMITTPPVKLLNTCEGCWDTDKNVCQTLSYRGTPHEPKKLDTAWCLIRPFLCHWDEVWSIASYYRTLCI